MPCCLVGLGSNLGNPTQKLDLALNSLDRHPDIEITTTSKWFSSSPAGGPAGQNDFLNGALLLRSSLSPERLLEVLQETENQLGRIHRQRWGPRTIDLDLLLYDDLIVRQPGLQVPHPCMSFRRFVLSPAVEIAAGMRHPEIGWTIQQLLDHLNKTPAYIAITGLPGSGKTALAKGVEEKKSARLIVDPIDKKQLLSSPRVPTGQTAEREIQFRSRRASLLNQNQWSDSKTYAISDFWLEQSLVYAEIWKAGKLACEVLASHQAESCHVVQPKLLVFLEATPEYLLDRIIERGYVEKHLLSLAWLKKTSQTFSHYLRQSYQGPLLRLDARAPQQAIEEVVAAIQAM